MGDLEIFSLTLRRSTAPFPWLKLEQKYVDRWEQLLGVGMHFLRTVWKKKKVCKIIKSQAKERPKKCHPM